MSEVNKKDIWAELRKPFDPKAVGKLPRGNVQLDYVGHAAVTDRLLSVDPLWSWEPLAYDEHGLPAYDGGDGLWIKLTIGGVTRLGWGDGNTPKERIGDAIRNAAMRFGVALDLWSKDELESNIGHPENKNIKPSLDKIVSPLEKQVAEKIVSKITADQVTKLLHAAKMKGFATKESATEAVNALSEQIFSKPFDKLNMDEATLLNKNLNEVKTTKESIEILLSDIPF